MTRENAKIKFKLYVTRLPRYCTCIQDHLSGGANFENRLKCLCSQLLHALHGLPSVYTEKSLGKSRKRCKPILIFLITCLQLYSWIVLLIWHLSSPLLVQYLVLDGLPLLKYLDMLSSRRFTPNFTSSMAAALKEVCRHHTDRFRYHLQQ